MSACPSATDRLIVPAPALLQVARPEKSRVALEANAFGGHSRRRSRLMRPDFCGAPFNTRTISQPKANDVSLCPKAPGDVRTRSLPQVAKSRRRASRWVPRASDRAVAQVLLFCAAALTHARQAGNFCSDRVPVVATSTRQTRVNFEFDFKQHPGWRSSPRKQDRLTGSIEHERTGRPSARRMRPELAGPVSSRKLRSCNARQSQERARFQALPAFQQTIETRSLRRRFLFLGNAKQRAALPARRPTRRLGNIQV